MAGSDPKTALRQQQRRIRFNAVTANPQAITQAATTALPPLLRSGSHLGLYWPIGAEPDLRPLVQPLINAGVAIALPAVVEGELTYRPWQPGSALSPDACGIPAPISAPALPPSALALLLAPALGFDRHGIRLGYGGGWFDRLRSAPSWRAVPALAVLPAACLCELVPRDPWDIPFNGWLDEQGLHRLDAV